MLGCIFSMALCWFGLASERLENPPHFQTNGFLVTCYCLPVVSLGVS